MKIVVRDRLYIHDSLVNRKRLSQFELRVYDESKCERCPLHSVRHTEDCETCPAYRQFYQLWDKVDRDGEIYYHVPAVDVDAALDRLDVPRDVPVKDIRPAPRFRSKLEYTGSLHTGQIVKDVQTVDQRALVAQWLKSIKIIDGLPEGGGLLRCPPRSGKTYMAAYLICHLKLRTVILASQIDWLVQFCDAFSQQTNAQELRSRPIVLVTNRGELRKKIEAGGIRMVSSWQDVPASADVVLSTYQSLIHKKKGYQRFVKYVKTGFGMLVIDEVHQTPALAYSRVIARTAARVRLGLTATVDRKDGKSLALPFIVGKVQASSEHEALAPQLSLMETGFLVPEFAQWFRLERFLAEHTDRNKMIVKQVIEDLKADERHSILVPVRTLAQCRWLVKHINEAWRQEDRWSSKIAEELTGGSRDREKILDRARSGKTRVIVAIEKIVKHGITCPRWTHVYVGISPTSNGPGFYQLTRRVCTPAVNKPRPVIRWWIDASKIGIACMRGLFFTRIDGVLDSIKKKRTLVSKSTLDKIFYIVKNADVYMASVADRNGRPVPKRRRRGPPSQRPWQGWTPKVSGDPFQF